MNNQSHIEFFLFSTTITSLREVDQIAPSLNYLIGKGKWNFDLEDCDKVLRLICGREEKADVISYLKLNSVFKFEFDYFETEENALQQN